MRGAEPAIADREFEAAIVDVDTVGRIDAARGSVVESEQHAGIALAAAVIVAWMLPARATEAEPTAEQPVPVDVS